MSYVNPICLLPFAVIAVPAVLLFLDELVGWIQNMIKENIEDGAEDNKKSS